MNFVESHRFLGKILNLVQVLIHIGKFEFLHSLKRLGFDIFKVIGAQIDSQRSNSSVVNKVAELGLMAFKVRSSMRFVQAIEKFLNLFPG